jgi:hypothetical protein
MNKDGTTDSREGAPSDASNAVRAVGAVIANTRGEVLALERVNAPGLWQMIQSKLEEDEVPLDVILTKIWTMLRIRTESLDLIQEFPILIAQEPEASMRVQSHGGALAEKWFLFHFSGQLPKTDQDLIHSCRRTTLRQFIDHVHSLRRPIYQRLAVVFGPCLTQ